MRFFFHSFIAPAASLFIVYAEFNKICGVCVCVCLCCAHSQVYDGNPHFSCRSFLFPCCYRCSGCVCVCESSSMEHHLSLTTRTVSLEHNFIVARDWRPSFYDSSKEARNHYQNHRYVGGGSRRFAIFRIVHASEDGIISMENWKSFKSTRFIVDNL